ncbi:hypothetical protein BRADI_4g19732v3, partial [Brachypodium distachyon]
TRKGTVDRQVKSNPRNNLIHGRHRCGKGRNSRGIITARHRGGGHKRLYQYDPNRNAYICLIHYGDGEKRYILHPRGAIIGDTIVSGTKVPISMGNALPLSAIVIYIYKAVCLATVGQVGNVGVNQKSLGRAGSKCWLGKRPIVRGVVMNPVDHPHGGGEGKAPIGRKKLTTP